MRKSLVGIQLILVWLGMIGAAWSADQGQEAAPADANSKKANEEWSAPFSPNRTVDQQRKTDEVCLEAVKRTKTDLEKLSDQHPLLSELSKCKIESEPCVTENGSKPRGIFHHLKYEKGVTYVPCDNPNGYSTPSGKIQRMTPPAMILDLYCCEGPVLQGFTKEYVLPSDWSSTDGLRCFYYIDIEPKDEKCYQAVREVIEKHVELLKKELKTIFPESSKLKKNVPP